MIPPYPIFEIRNKTVQIAILFPQNQLQLSAVAKAAVARPYWQTSWREWERETAKERAATRRRTTPASPSRIQTSVASEPLGCNTTGSTATLLALGSVSISPAKTPTASPPRPNDPPVTPCYYYYHSQYSSRSAWPSPKHECWCSSKPSSVGSVCVVLLVEWLISVLCVCSLLQFRETGRMLHGLVVWK